MYNKEIVVLLDTLGIGHRFQGRTIVYAAVQLALEDESRLLHFTEQITSVLAQRYGMKLTNIERSIRTVSGHAWQTNPAYLCRLAGYPLNKAPSVSELIDILLTSIIRRRAISSSRN